MSTYLYLECRAHDPYLRSTDEVGQHLSDLESITEVLTERQAILAADHIPADMMGPYFARAALEFLRQHPHCPLTVRDEYGRQHPLPHQTQAGTGPVVRHSVLVQLPQVCGSRTTMRARLGATPGSSRLTATGTVIVDFTACEVITDSALDELISFTLAGQPQRTLLVLGRAPDGAMDELLERCSRRAVNPTAIRQI